jgi:uncharacterized phiE125 gp8 family phage protein
MNTRRITQPTFEPVTITELKRELRITHTDDDDSLTAYISQAREFFEHNTGCSLGASQWRSVFACVSSKVIFLPATPLVSVQSVKAWPADGGAQIDITGFAVVDDMLPGAVILAEYPELFDRPDALTVNYTAGYASAADVPHQIKRAILLLASLSYEQRLPLSIGNIVNELPFSLKHILDTHRISGFIT